MSGDGGRAGRDTDVSGAEAVATGGTTYSDTKIKDRKKKDFVKSGADKIDKTTGGPPTLQVMKKPLQVGSIKTRTFFDEKVLASSKAKKNIGYTQAEFRKLSLTEQNKVYDNYMKGRMSGQTDAYGNLQQGYRQETINVKKADGTMTTKTVIMGGNDKGGQTKTKTTQQIEAENIAAQKAAQAAADQAAQAEADQAAAEQAEAYKKKRLAITSSRSLFARPGGRGFFN
jgi:hypothetical protein